MNIPAPGHQWSRSLLLAGHDEEFRRLLEVTLPGPLVELVPRLDQAHPAIQEGRYALVLFDLEAAPAELAPLIKTAPEGLVWAATLRAEEASRAAELVELGVERVFYHPVAPAHLARQLSWLLRLETPALALPESPKAALMGRQSELFQTFMATTRERIAKIFQRASTDSDAAERVELAREAHRMVGTLGSFGFPLGSEMARKLEELLSAGPLSQSSVIKVTSLCQDLVDLIEGSVEGTTGPVLPTGPNLPLVSVVTADEELRAALAVSAPRYGLRLVTPPAEGFREFLRSAASDAVVYDFCGLLPGLPADVTDLLSGLVCPVVAVCPALSLRQRVEISALGAASIVEKPFDVEPLLENLQGMLSLPVASRVLAIDDDPLFLKQLESLIVPLGTEFTAVSDPEALWLALEGKDPDLVLLDIDMPDIDGLDLCRAMRSDSRFAETPVVFITSSLSAEVRRAAYEAGGEDYIPKTIEGAELRIRIATRLRRARASRRAETDPLTGLLTRAPAVKALNHLLKLGERRSIPVSLAVVDLDHFKSVNDRFGHPTGDLVLQRVAELFRNTLRSEDVISRWGGEEFVTGMFLMDKDQAAARLRAALEQLRQEVFHVSGHELTISFSAGVAQFPVDGRDLNELYRAADGALYLSKQQRSTVTVVSAQPLEGDQVDLVLVEDDHPLGTVLMEAFAEQGWRAVWFQDGAEAAQALLCEEGALRPRVIVVDRELPTLDGVGLIEWLSDEGVCRRARVITVSAKMTTDEINAVLDLGVFDHVSKPFSLPVLLRRIEMARAAR
jgi:diguanylate cyclase (GGDEF)-like protein